MALEIRSTLKVSPIRMVLYGKDGVGKSTFAAGAPACVFVTTENGLANIDARDVPSPSTWAELLTAVEFLSSKSNDEVGTIAVDSLDWAEGLCWAHVCAIGDDKGKKKSINEFRYGDGYVAALMQWRALIAALDRAHASGKHILLIAHSSRKTVKNPAGDDYDAWQIKLNEKASGTFREWVDVVGFAELDTATVKGEGGAKGISTRKRVLRCNPAAHHEGKSRYALPDVLPLNWAAFHDATVSGSYAAIPALKSELDALIGENTDLRGRCNAFLHARGENVASIREAIETVRSYVNQTEKEESK